MATVPGFAKDSVGRWRIGEMEVTATSSIVSKRGVSPSRASFWGKSDGESPFGALKGFLDMRYRSACAEFSSCWEPVQREASQRVVEPRNTRTLVSSPSGTCRAIAMSVWRTSTI